MSRIIGTYSALQPLQPVLSRVIGSDASLSHAPARIGQRVKCGRLHRDTQRTSPEGTLSARNPRPSLRLASMIASAAAR